MFKVHVVDGSDDGIELESLISEMDNKGYKLRKITPHQFENISLETKMQTSTQWKGNKAFVTDMICVSSYLCVFEELPDF